MLRVIPFSTWFGPNDFQRSTTSITSGPHRDEGDDVIGEEHGDRAHHHAAGRPLADALRAARRRVAAPGRDDGDDGPEHHRLEEAVHDVGRIHELAGVLDEWADRDARDVHAHEVAAAVPD